jgi:hypothetical protein
MDVGQDFQAQWDNYNGVCGVCGDDYGGVQHNMAGGKWALGEITATYTQGQDIDVTIRITANHLGFFNFSLCVNNDFTKKRSAILVPLYLKY